MARPEADAGGPEERSEGAREDSSPAGKPSGPGCCRRALRPPRVRASRTRGVVGSTIGALEEPVRRGAAVGAARAARRRAAEAGSDAGAAAGRSARRLRAPRARSSAPNATSAPKSTTRRCCRCRSRPRRVVVTRAEVNGKTPRRAGAGSRTRAACTSNRCSAAPNSCRASRGRGSSAATSCASSARPTTSNARRRYIGYRRARPVEDRPDVPGRRRSAPASCSDCSSSMPEASPSGSARPVRSSWSAWSAAGRAAATRCSARSPKPAQRLLMDIGLIVFIAVVGMHAGPARGRGLSHERRRVLREHLRRGHDRHHRAAGRGRDRRAIRC